MGLDKALLPFGEGSLAVWMARLAEKVCGAVALVGNPSKYSSLGFPVIEDVFPGYGPLAGIHAALRHSDAPFRLVLGCDMPYLSVEFLEKLQEIAGSPDVDVVVPKSETFGYEPLCAIYARSCLAPVEKALQAGQRKISDVLDRLRVRAVSRPEWQAYDRQGTLFRNLNTREDYERARKELLVGGQDHLARLVW